jgi:HEPN domain-containing protein
MLEQTAAMTAYVKDPAHWLFKFSPDEWIRASMRELRAAEAAYKQRNARAGLAGCRRAAGMALNAALIVEPNEAWKRTYIEHLMAVAKDDGVPGGVSEACQRLIDAQPPGPNLVILRSPAADEKLVEAARDVMAHAYAVVKRNEAIRN